MVSGCWLLSLGDCTVYIHTACASVPCHHTTPRTALLLSQQVQTITILYCIMDDDILILIYFTMPTAYTTIIEGISFYIHIVSV